MVRADDAADVRYVCQKCGYVIPESWSGHERAMANREVDCVDGYDDSHDWEAEYV